MLTTTGRARLATAWLDGCSGCHMSLLDLDEALVSLAPRIQLVYGPLVDAQEFPEGVDVALVEGAVGNRQDLALIQKIRSRSRVLVALGDCAVTGNVPAMRNPIPVQQIIDRVYGNGDSPGTHAVAPSAGVPALLRQAVPIHQVVPVDYHVPGCPPRPEWIGALLKDLLAGRKPETGVVQRFG